MTPSRSQRAPDEERAAGRPGTPRPRERWPPVPPAGGSSTASAGSGVSGVTGSRLDGGAGFPASGPGRDHRCGVATRAEQGPGQDPGGLAVAYGLDPVDQDPHHPVGPGIEPRRVARQVVDETGRLGADGVRSFEDVCDYARTAGLLVIADVKRGDIGSTARAYAAAYLEPRGTEEPVADAITVNSYLGRDSLEPFVAECRRSGRGIFCLVKTSNPGGVDVQDLRLTDGSVVWQQVARLVGELGEGVVGESGLSSVGAVVGATYPRAVSEARRLMPQAILLLAGVGAQGATPADVARAFTSGPASALVSVSRSVNYAFRRDGADWRTAAGAEAARLRAEVWRASGW